MNDAVVKVLLLVLGFLLGVSGQIIVNLNNEKRKKTAIIELMRTEIAAFIQTCDKAEKSRIWDSSSVEIISRSIMQSYFTDKLLLITSLKPEARQGVYNFYLEVNALLSLIESHRKLERIDTDGSTAAIGPGTYKGIADRSRLILADIK